MRGLRQLLAVLLLAVWATPSASFAVVGLHVLLGTHQGHHQSEGHSHGQDHHRVHGHDHLGHDHPGHGPQGPVHHDHDPDGRETLAPSGCDLEHHTHAQDHDLSALAQALAHGHHHPADEAVPEHQEQQLAKATRLLSSFGTALAVHLPSDEPVLGLAERELQPRTSSPSGREPTVPLFTVKCALLL